MLNVKRWRFGGGGLGCEGFAESVAITADTTMQPPIGAQRTRETSERKMTAESDALGFLIFS